MNTGVLALLGSGETGPGMTKVHRGLLRTQSIALPLNLNTPYGFQENVDLMTAKLQDYFSVSLHVDMANGDLRYFESATPQERLRFRHAVRSANYVFAGPGSPSFALRQWQPLGIVDDLRSVLSDGGVVCFSSAAALTLGTYTPPVYEVYKVGAELEWLPGLDLMGAVGLSCVVLPHYNNAEGSNYDTSRCYIGERRLRILEEMLPTDLGVLGIDEHTAAIIDFASQTLEVTGKGDVHWRHHQTVTDIANGSTVPLSELGAASTPLATIEELAPPVPSSDPAEVMALKETQERLVNVLEELRLAARAEKNFAVADKIRDALTNSGVEIRDSALKPA